MKITILQWNIWTNEKPSNVLSLIKETNADIVCLQELTENFPSTGHVDVPDYLSQQLKYELHYAVAHTWPTDQGLKTQGNGILSRFPITQKNQAFVTGPTKPGSNGYSNEGRVVAIAQIQLPAIQLTVATTHLSYTDRLQETPAKVVEEAAFFDILEQLPSPLVFSGDFNVSEDADLIKKLVTKYQNIGPAFSEKTWTTKPFHYHQFHEDSLSWRLDHVFATQDIKVTKTHIIDTSYSDHLPILVEIEI